MAQCYFNAKQMVQTNKLNVITCDLGGVVFLIFLDQVPFYGATDCLYFGVRVSLPMGFKDRVGDLGVGSSITANSYACDFDRNGILRIM